MNGCAASKSYDELKHYYDNFLNKDLLKTGNLNDVPTPIGCIEEILSCLPTHVWSNTNFKIMDPCCGNGNWHLVARHLIVQHCKEGDSMELMATRFYFNDVNPQCLANVMDIFSPPECNISCSDYLASPKSTPSYDLIMANPPYAHIMPDGKRSAKNHNLVGAFIQQSLTELNVGGYLVFLVPDSWMSLSDRNTKYVQMLTSQCVPLQVNVHLAKKWFPKVGSTFTWFIVQKVPLTNTTRSFAVQGVHMGFEYQGKCVISKPMSYLPLVLTTDVLSILSKTLDSSNDLPRFQIETSSDLHKHTKKHLFADALDEGHPYKVIHTFNKVVYSSRPHKYHAEPKVFISLTNHYATRVEANCGMTQSVAFVRCETIAEAERIKAILDHELYVFLNNICRWGNFNNIRILQRFPKPLESADDSNLYAHFNINAKEKAFIRAFLKSTRIKTKTGNDALVEQNSTRSFRAQDTS